MAAPLYTTVSVQHRTISQAQPDRKMIRYALSRASNGDVYWRADTFADPEDPTLPLRWLSHEGRMTVGEVIAAAPSYEKVIRTWTGAEVAAGAADADWQVEQRRARALDQLRAELTAARIGRSTG
jgi:hypothetical protein